MRSIPAILAIILTLAACGSPVDDDREPDLGNIEVLALLLELEEGAMERWRTGDPGGFVELASPADFSYFDPALESRLDGKKAFKEYLEPLWGEIGYEGSEFVNPKVQVHGYAAVLTYNYISTVALEDGTPWRTPWNVTEVYARSGGRWEMIHSHFTVNGSEKPEKLDLRHPGETAEKGVDDLLHTLLSLEEAAMKRWRSGDPQGFLELSAPEVTYFDPSVEGRIDGLDRLRVHYSPIAGAVRYDNSTFADSRVQRHGDLAVLTFNYLASNTDPAGEPAAGTRWNITEVFARFGDDWKIVHTHRSYTRGVRPPAE